MTAHELNPAQAIVANITDLKLNTLINNFPKGSLEDLIYHLLESTSSEKKCIKLQEYISCNEHNEMLTPDIYTFYILAMEIGISRIELINWLVKKDCDYSKWKNVIDLFMIQGFPEVREFLSTIIKSTNTDSNYRSEIAEMQLYCCQRNDSQYLMDNPLQSDFSPEPILKKHTRKLRVAFTSEKFATNILSSQTVYQDTIFSGLPDDIEVWLFSLKDHSDKNTAPYRKKSHQFINLFNLTDNECIAIIKKANIDIVVDLFGATPTKYWKLFEDSIRVSSFDVDCFIKDYYHYNLEEKNNFPLWKNKFTGLSPVTNQFFWPTPDPVKINPNTPSTSNKYITFGCFSRLIKIHPRNYDTWAQLLNEVPKSVIAFSFIQLIPALQYIILKEFNLRGIGPERINFFPRTTPKKHLSKYNSIDLVLDTFPVGSGFTALDSLWMGIPIIGLIKKTDTVKSTIKAYKALKKESWAAKNEREYIDICKKIGLDEEYRIELKKNLRQEVLNSDLVNGKKFSKEMYAALKKIAVDNKN